MPSQSRTPTNQNSTHYNLDHGISTGKYTLRKLTGFGNKMGRTSPKRYSAIFLDSYATHYAKNPGLLHGKHRGTDKPHIGRRRRILHC
jgi:hypothetical protein